MSTWRTAAPVEAIRARPPTVARASAALGAVAWVAAALVGPFGTVDLVILLAGFVEVPLAVSLIGTRNEGGGYPLVYRAVVALQPIGAVGLAVASLATVGAIRVGGPASARIVAAVALSPWLATIGLLATYGIWRLRTRGIGPVEEALIDAGTVYAVVGAGSYLFHVLGLDFGFPPAIIHLTAAHFHYAGLLLPVVTGLAGRAVADGRPRSAYRVGAVTVMGGMPLVAVGITLSRLADLRIGELFGATLFAAGVFVLALVLLGMAVVPERVASRPIPVLSRGLLAVAGGAIAVTMGFAAAYGYARAFDPGLLSLSTMIRFHGVTNAVGFALSGLMAWYVAERADRT